MGDKQTLVLKSVDSGVLYRRRMGENLKPTISEKDAEELNEMLNNLIDSKEKLPSKVKSQFSAVPNIDDLNYLSNVKPHLNPSKKSSNEEPGFNRFIIMKKLLSFKSSNLNEANGIVVTHSITLVIDREMYKCTRCVRCDDGFEPHEKIVNSNGELWHPQCFV